ncbi:MAG: DUF4258 domain-containing protein [Verrucomicrobia bacterium]|nr:DUF4258 domain-containing protein [Verrucomicrobiota bacterium]
MEYQLSKHAAKVLEERQISIAWLEQTLSFSEPTLPDPYDTEVERCSRKIPECEGQVRVAVNVTVTPNRVVSVFFDRAMKGRL